MDKEREDLKNNANIQQLKEICMPIVNYLKENENIYTDVHISMNEIKVTSVKYGIPLYKEAINHKD